MIVQPTKYGEDDASYDAVGRAEGLRNLVGLFYDKMESLPIAQKIRAMHPDDLTESRDKLYCFLSGWMGGPRLFVEKYGPIAIPRAHSHLIVEVAERDAWLACMEAALNDLDYPQDFKDYLMKQLVVPAERIRLVSSKVAK